MKKLLLISGFVVFSSWLLKAQTDSTLTVDCGGNIVICPDDFYAFITAFALEGDVKNENLDTLFIGRNVKVVGGVEPYTYTWSCDAQPWYNGSFSLDANDFLNDITSANPHIIYEPLKNVTVFRLQVTDAKGLVVVDSLALLRSSFSYYTDAPNDLVEKTEGNKIYLTGEQKNMDCLFPPVTYFAVINSDTIALPAFITVQETDSVTIFGIDSVGCHDYPRKYSGERLLVSINESSAADDNVKLVANTLVFNDNSEKQIRVYSTNGQLLYSKNTTDTRFDLPSLKSVNQCVCSVIVNNKTYSFHLFRP
ncbi:MAG: hypothetical protein J6U13_05975 [Salinivirgaceae bacterium]|nr:hypothetical protein [Salinivirgaceae bacterium]